MTDKSLTVALAQIHIDPGAVDANLDRAISTIEQAASDGADLVVLPELFTVGYFSFSQYHESAEGLDGPTLSRIQETAELNEVAILAGTVIEDLACTTEVYTPAATGLANTSVLIDSEGRRQLVYRKHHLFGVNSSEQELLVPGDRLPVAELGGFTIGISTCYDLRFPELYRTLISQGATLLLVPSAWPYPKLQHWETLSRARAIENLCYVGTANGSGTFDDTTLLGRSTLFDPWGQTLASSGDEPAIVMATLHSERVSTIRDEFPAHDDRRL